MTLRIREEEIQSVVERVRRRYGDRPEAPAPRPAVAPPAPASEVETGDGVHATVDSAVTAARAAFEAYRDLGLDVRHRVVDAVREAMRRHGPELARKAAEETGIGRAEDKVLKNELVTEKTPGPEDLEPETWTGDRGMTITEYAPFGVIAAITPTTNPTATIINNTIAAVSAGNAVVFNVHPNAKAVSRDNVRLIHRAIESAGGPPNLIASIAEPTLESAEELMHHPRVRILLVTGGPGVVRAALATDKRAITAGPGNPPVVVDETADLEVAGREIVRGASFDNNVICTDEKEVFVVGEVADRLLRALAANDAVILKEHQVRKLERLVFRELGAPGEPGKVATEWIGKNAGAILSAIGEPAGPELRLLVADVPPEHPLVWTEQMMPVLPVVRVPDAARAIDLAVRAEHGYGHTASIYSRDVGRITEMARRIDVSIFVANAAHLAGLGAGGEGFTSYSIASPTGEGLTRPRTFSRIRRLTLAGGLRIV